MAITPYQAPPPTNGHVNGNGQKADFVVAHDVVKEFILGDQFVRALAGISLRIPQGQFVAIMGPSGSGKSTLLYLLGGLDRPTDGHITVAGREVENLSSEDLAAFRRETIGFVFQAFHLVPTMTALENVSLPGVFIGMSREEREQRGYKLLAAIGMDDRLDHRPSQLSGGQQQRVAIARALFNDPPIIMADEPTGALDSKTGQTVMKLLRWFCRSQGRTIIVVTHDPGVASYADRIINLKDGLVVEDRMLRPRIPRVNVWRTVEEALAAEADETHETVE
ncbi:MAG: ABC transporter ATP-binding protein [Anaerolineae bacterium]|nr:ABC transporter ATP-binding protein [Anaerolineae bacterium]